MKKLPIKRIPYYKEILPNKEYLSNSEFWELFNNEIIIEEKYDGKGHYKDGYFYENLKYKHTIHYTNIPQCIIDNDYNMILDFESNISKQITSYSKIDKNLTPRILFRGKIDPSILFDFLDWIMNLQSDMSEDKIEGIVVKNYKKQLFGKISRFDNSKEITEHWSRKPKVLNRG